MSEIVIEQALYARREDGSHHLLARSPGLEDSLLSEVERLCTGFSNRPTETKCPLGVFAKPLGKKRVAIVQVADQNIDGMDRPISLAFYVLAIARADYLSLGGDPFFVADYFPPLWNVRGQLAPLRWQIESSPPRTVEQVRRVLQRDNGPSLLGGSQVIVDGGRLVFERPAPDTELLRDLWTLLPTTTRARLWPATFVFGNDLGFDVLVMPPGKAADCSSHVTEEQAADYPQGRYELSLQTAAEAGDQETLDTLLARRSRNETLRLAVMILAGVLVVSFLVRFITPSPRPTHSQPTTAASGPEWKSEEKK